MGPMLRSAARQKILGKVEESYFGLENYSVQFGGESRLVNIEFLGDRRFSFILSKMFSNSSFEDLSIEETPGENYLTKEAFRVSSFDAALDRLWKWMDRVREETISANPFAREVAGLRADLEQRLVQLGEELNGFFSKSEAEELSERLAAFSERLTELASKNQALEEAVNGLKRTVEDLQASVSVVNRGTWYRMSGGRLLSGLKAFATSKEVREFALDAAKKFLLEGPK